MQRYCLSANFFIGCQCVPKRRQMFINLSRVAFQRSEYVRRLLVMLCYVTALWCGGNLPPPPHISRHVPILGFEAITGFA